MSEEKTEDGLTGQDENLDGKNDHHIVDLESRVTIVEREEPVDGELGTEVIVLSTEHLLTHTGTNLGLEIENSTET